MKVALAWIDPDDPTDSAVAFGLAESLLALGHDVSVVGPRRRRGAPARGMTRGVRVYRVAGTRELLRLQRRERFDLWHCHVFGRGHRPLARAVRAAGLPMVASLHLALPDYLPAVGGRRELWDLLRQARHVTAVSRASLTRLRALFPGLSRRSSVVVNGVALSSPDGSALPALPYALCASRLAPYKGIDLLLMAFARLKDAGRGLRLVLCGRDQLRGRLQDYARRLGLEDEVVFAGAVSPARLRRLMDGCRFFVLPSRNENLPLALLEAMAAGKPVLAARVGGVPEIVTDGKDGLLAPPANVAALAAAMLRLDENSRLRARLGKAARRRSRAFTWTNAAAAYARLYHAAA